MGTQFLLLFFISFTLFRSLPYSDFVIWFKFCKSISFFVLTKMFHTVSNYFILYFIFYILYYFIFYIIIILHYDFEIIETIYPPLINLKWKDIFNTIFSKICILPYSSFVIWFKFYKSMSFFVLTKIARMFPIILHYNFALWLRNNKRRIDTLINLKWKGIFNTIFPKFILSHYKNMYRLQTITRSC